MILYSNRQIKRFKTLNIYYKKYWMIISWSCLIWYFDSCSRELDMCVLKHVCECFLILTNVLRRKKPWQNFIFFHKFWHHIPQFHTSIKSDINFYTLQTCCWTIPMVLWILFLKLKFLLDMSSLKNSFHIYLIKIL